MLEYILNTVTTMLYDIDKAKHKDILKLYCNKQ